MELKVGDRVRLVNVDMNPPEKEFFEGKEGRILFIDGSVYPYCVDIPGTKWIDLKGNDYSLQYTYWNENELEKIE